MPRPRPTDLGMPAAGSVLVALVLCVAPGCSLLFVEGPPPNHERLPAFDCTTSKVAPVVDTVFAAGYAVSAVAQTTESSGYSHASPTVAIAMVGIAALETVSAVHGYATTSECKAAKKKWLERQLAVPSGACGSDLDCRGDRVCEAGVCMMPPPPLPEGL